MDPQKVTREDIRRMMKSDHPKLFATLSSMLMGSATKGMAGVHSTIDNISNFVSDKQEPFMNVLLQGLRNSAQRTPVDFMTIGAIIFILLGFETYDACLLRPVIWKAGGMAVLLEAFDVLSISAKSFSALSINDLSMDALRKAMSIIDTWHQCFMIMLDAPTTIEGRTELTRALQGGFLRNFVSCQPNIAQPPALSLRVKIAECLTGTSRFLIYPSIMIAAEPEIERISRAHHQKMAGGSMGKEWRSFLRYFVERLVFKCYNDFFDSRSGKAYLCDQCNMRANLKKCGGCQMAFYCSLGCQRDAWSKHKEVCRKKTESNEQNALKTPSVGQIPAIPARKEVEFMLRSAMVDVDRHQASLRILASQKYPNVAYNSLVVLVDYCEFPPVLDVYPFAVFKAETERFPNIIAERSVKRILSSNGKLAGLELRIPNNGKRMSIHESYSPSALGQLIRPAQPSLYRTQYVDSRGRPVSASKDNIDELILSSGFNTNVLLETDISVSEARERTLYACQNLFGQAIMDDLLEALGVD